MLKEGKHDEFKREILCLATSKKLLTYYVTKHLFVYSVLEKPDEFFNDNILGKKIHDWFNKVNGWLVDHGYPKSEYPEYKPHISLTEKKDIDKPEWKKEYEQKVKFKIHVVTDTDREEIFRSIC